MSRWWRSHSVRVRLTLWYVAAMMVILAVYCLIIAHPGFVFKTGQEHLTTDDWFVEKNLNNKNTSASTSDESASRV